jgi:serine/threonine protein kinase
MHCLVGLFVEVEPTLKQPVLWPLKIVFPSGKSRLVFLKSHAQQSQWLTYLRSKSLHSELQDHYLMSDFLGQGQFGEVRRGVHIPSDTPVAIKIIQKPGMKVMQMYQQLREIDILKVCQHPNIIQLRDLFENGTSYFIVCELVQGKDLFDYLKDRDYKLPE